MYGFSGSTRSDVLKCVCALRIIPINPNSRNLRSVKFKRLFQLSGILFSSFQLHGIHWNLVLKVEKNTIKKRKFLNLFLYTPRPFQDRILPSQTQKLTFFQSNFSQVVRSTLLQLLHAGHVWVLGVYPLRYTKMCLCPNNHSNQSKFQESTKCQIEKTVSAFRYLVFIVPAPRHPLEPRPQSQKKYRQKT